MEIILLQFFGQTPLCVASEEGHSDVCKALITYGKADVNKAAEVNIQFLIFEVKYLTMISYRYVSELLTGRHHLTPFSDSLYFGRHSRKYTGYWYTDFDLHGNSISAVASCALPHKQASAQGHNNKT